MKRHDSKLNAQRLASAISIRERGLDALLAKTELSSSHLATMVQFGTALAQYSAALSASDPRIESGLAAAARGGAALFASLGADKPRELLLHDGKARLITSAQPNSEAAPNTWWDSFHAARCLGDVYSLDRLAAADVDLVRKSPTTTGEFGYLLISALAGYHRREADTPERLVAALRAADPATADSDMRNYVEKIAGPEIELWFRIVDNDERAFGAALEKSLELHRAYYARHDAPVLGQLALGPAAAACAATDSGFDLAVMSDYVPQHILELDRKELIDALN